MLESWQMNRTDDPYALKLSDAIDAAQVAQQRLDNINFDFIQKRSQFYDMLTILDGSALLASTSLLAYFAPNHGHIQLLYILEWAWIVLLVAMVATLLRNFVAPRVSWHEAHASYTKKKNTVELAEVDFYTHVKAPVRDRHSSELIDPAEEIRVHKSNAEKWLEGNKEADAKARKFRYVMNGTQFVGVVLSLTGLVFLVIFTLVNIKPTDSRPRPQAGSVSRLT